MKYISALMMVLATISNVSAMQLKTVAEAKFDFDDAGVGSGQSQTIDATTNATRNLRLATKDSTTLNGNSKDKWSGSPEVLMLRISTTP